MTSQDNVRSLSPFDLPTQQRRLRHFKCLAVRNLMCKGYMGKDVVKLQTYFSLHKDTQSKAFYTSEKITGSLNPSWQSFDLSRLEEQVDMAAKFVVVRVWGGHDKKFRLLLEWQVNFSGLFFLTDKLQKDGMKFATNSLVFGLFEKCFGFPADSSQSKLPEYTPVLSSLPAVRVEQITLHSSYGVSSLSRIHTILRAIRQTQVTVRKVHRSIEDKLLASQEKSTKLSERELLLLKVDQLRGELQSQTTRLQCEKETRNKQKNILKQRGLHIQESSLLMANRHDELLSAQQQHIVTREDLVKTNAQLNMRRKQLIEELASYIYPITELAGNKGYLICGIHLPNAEEFQGHDDYSIAVALGYTCHMVIMMSEYLDTPLWYPMVHRGSKSVIRDHIISKLAEKDRDFVLYGKNKDKIQFHYGVYLMNKNISQLRYQFGLGTQDLRLTLHNLKSLLELRLGVKFESSRPTVLSPINSVGRQLTIGTNNSHNNIKDNHSNDVTDGHAHSNQEQMIEKLIQESRAMTHGEQNNLWVANLNTKPTWSPRTEKKFKENLAENQIEVKTSLDDGIDENLHVHVPASFSNNVSKEAQADWIEDGTQVVSEGNTAISNLSRLAKNRDSYKLSVQTSSQAYISCEPDTMTVSPGLNKTGLLHDSNGVRVNVHKTESESAVVDGESESRQLIGGENESESAQQTLNETRSGNDRQINDEHVEAGTFKTSAFNKFKSIDSSEEVTENSHLSPSEVKDTSVVYTEGEPNSALANDSTRTIVSPEPAS